MTRLTIHDIRVRLSDAMKHHRTGEVLRVKTTTERRYVMLLAAAHNWDLRTERDGKEFRVIAA